MHNGSCVGTTRPFTTQRRLNRAYEPTKRYVDSFVSHPVAILGRFVSQATGRTEGDRCAQLQRRPGVGFSCLSSAAFLLGLRC